MQHANSRERYEMSVLQDFIPPSAVKPTPQDIRLRAECLRLLYTQASKGLLAASLNSFVLIIILWKVISPRALLFWLAANLLILAARCLLVRSYWRATPDTTRVKHWEFLFILGLTASGIVMGSGGFFLYPADSFPYQVFLVFFLGIAVAVATVLYSALKQAFLAYSVPVLFPVILRLMLHGEAMQMAVGGILFLFFWVMFSTASFIAGTTRKSLELRFENSDLIDHLTTAKGRAEQVIEELKHEISNRRKAEKAREDSEHQYRRLVETMNEGLGVQDENGIITYVNDKLCDILGHSASELVGRPVRDLLEERIRPFFEEINRRRLKKRTLFETNLVAKSQRAIPCLISASPVFDRSGSFKGVIYVISDITVRKRAERKLRESEEKYRTIFEQSPLGILHFDETGTITAFNKSLSRMSGSPQEHFSGLNLLESLQNESMRNAVADCLSGTPGYYEGSYHWLFDGQVAEIKASFGPVFGEHGKVEGGIGIIEDISERKRAERQLRDQLHFLQTLIDTIPNPIFYKDTSGQYLGCNKAFEDRIGMKREEIIGKTAYDLYPQYMADKYVEMDNKLLQSSGEQIHETSLLYAQGTLHDVIINKGTFTDANGVLTGLVGVVLDITERKQAEAALRRAHDELEIRVRERTAELARTNEELRIEVTERKRVEEELRKSSEKLKVFAYSIAHDLKSPAVGIHGLTRLLHAQYRDLLDERGKNYCDQILKASEHVASLAAEINIYVASKEAALKVEKVNIREILEMVRDEFSTRLSILRVDWMQEETLPVINADRVCMVRVFRNLVDNALKYGGEKLSFVQIGYRDLENDHLFLVRDDGVGVSIEESERIFGLFQRNGQTTGGVEGSGLGLNIVKEITERHGGRVWVEPGYPKGTTFFFTISKSLRPSEDSALE